MSERSDEELLEAWRAGDERAGSLLFQRHFDAIYRFFRSKIEADVEDMVQQTFLACVRNRDAFRGDSSFRTYLFRVAKSKLYDALRKRMRGETPVSMCTMQDLRTSPSTWVARRQDLQVLQAALERLPLELQLAVELFYFENQTAGQVAEILEIPEGTVRSRVRRAIEQLRVLVAESAGASADAEKTLAGLDELLSRSA